MTPNELETLAALVAKELATSISAAAVPGKWLTLKEAMAYCKVKHPDTIRTWITEGYIYGHKRTGQWIIDRESIDDWFNSEKVAS
jgi:hypothetical protein